MARISPNSPIVILTGAGISKESGLDTFRCDGGIWSQVRLEDVATPEGFARDPEMVHAFYNDRRRGLLAEGVEPNAAHAALARLQRNWPAPVLLVTQNIDDLHERAGSPSVLHMHGELLKARCTETDRVFDWREDLTVSTPSPATGRPGHLRPHVVWFGEMPFGMDAIAEALAACGLFVSVGTSGNVYPAAGFVREAKELADASTVELNLDPSEGRSWFDEAIHGPATEVVPAFVDRLLASA